MPHWQIFLLILSVPMIVAIVDDPEPTAAKRIANAIAFFLFLFWVTSIVFISNDTRRYRTIFLTAVIALVIVYIPLTMDNGDNEPANVPLTILGFLLVGLCIWMAGKALSSAESKPDFKESLLNALLIFIHPIGIWIIQPRINKLVARKQVDEPSENN